MKHQLLDRLRCPRCHGSLRLSSGYESQREVESGQLVCRGCDASYQISGFVPRFVPVDNYATSFGFQWNRFRETQLDSFCGQPISRERFFRQSGWAPGDLKGKAVLDVGCGAGRFAEVVLSCGAEVVALDYSDAVDACWHNLEGHPGLSVVQGDIYHLPFTPASFDYVYCFGVLQHTPRVEEAFLSLPGQLRPGGHLAVDVYPRLILNSLWPKYWLRPLTKRMVPEHLFKLVRAFVPATLPISVAIGRIPIVGRKLRHAIPVANYDGIYPLSRRQLTEWAILDTFDMLSPTHDQPQSAETLCGWFKKAGLNEVQVFRSGFLVGRGSRSQTLR